MADKAFTQEEVNTIIQDRLAKEKAKFDKQISDMQEDIKRREKRLEAREKLQEKGLPAELIDLVKLDSDETFKSSLDILENAYKTKVPESKPTSGGGYSPAAGATPDPDANIRKAMTRLIKGVKKHGY